jgi:cell wall-associated NlpC family hydrolase
VASAREAPDHEAEMGTQVLMGHSVRAWQQYASDERPGTWFGVETQDGYRAWLEKETFIRCSRQELDDWNQSELLIVTAMEDCILENPHADAQAVSDVVFGNLVKRTGERTGWHAVALPDGRRGYLAGNSAEPYRAWRAARKPTAEAIEQTGRRFLGRPYLWGGNSPKGLDCSGFVKLVFFLNGIDLLRNASQQARQGVEVPLEPAFSRLKKGDLVFFGRQRGAGRPERVTHVGIYLQDGLFIHCLGRVQVSDLDPSSPIWEDYRLQVFCARRLLP